MRVYCEDEDLQDKVNNLYKKVKKLQTKVLKVRIYKEYALHSFNVESVLDKQERLDLETKLTENRNELLALIADNAPNHDFELFL